MKRFTKEQLLSFGRFCAVTVGSPNSVDMANVCFDLWFDGIKKAKVKPEEKRDLLILHISGMSFKEISLKYNISYSYCREIIQRETRKEFHDPKSSHKKKFAEKFRIYYEEVYSARGTKIRFNGSKWEHTD